MPVWICLGVKRNAVSNKCVEIRVEISFQSLAICRRCIRCAVSTEEISHLDISSFVNIFKFIVLYI